MNKLLLVTILIIPTIGVIFGQNAATDQRVTEERAHWIQNVLRTVDHIRPGMSRKSLERFFEEDGGLQFRTQTRYTFKDCPYIKIDVEFAVADESDGNSAYRNPADKIVKISRPYLEYPSAD